MPEVVFVEYLNTVNVPGTPPHDLQLKIGALVMFIRNVNFDSGVVNGKKGMVRGLSAKFVDVEVIAEGFPIVKIPSICFETQVGHKGITFRRHQFPLRLCYAMTINKSQGQTLQNVGLDLRDDVFTHGQLYVALSRTTSRENILCLVKTNRLIDNVPHVANVVLREFILAATGREPLYLLISQGMESQIKAILTPTAAEVATRTMIVTTTATTARAVATTTATSGPLLMR